MEFMISLLLVLLAAWVAGIAATRLGYPAMLGELLAGMLLGPSLLELLPAHEGLKHLAEVGIFVMMLYVGTEIDPRELLKSSKAGFLAAIGGFTVPFAAGYLVTWGILKASGYEPWPSLIGGLFVGITCAGTSLAAKSRILLDLGLLNTRMALVMMAGALFSDTSALILFAGVNGFAADGALHMGTILLVLVKAAAFFAVCILLGVLIFPRIEAFLRKLGLKGGTATLTVLLITALAFGELAHLLGLHNILGAFMAGIFLRKAVADRREFHELTNRIHDMAIGFLAPIFFVTAGFDFDFSVFSSNLGLLMAVLVAASLGKLFGTMLFYLPSGNGWREGLAIGCGMNGRGAVEIIVAGIALQKGFIDQTLFSVIVFMAIFTTLLVPATLKWCVAWIRRRGELVLVAERRGYLVVGAGPLARLVGSMLAGHLPVRLIDRNAEQVAIATNEGLTAVLGNALDETTLEEAQALTVEGVIGLTPNHELNLLAARFAADRFMVPNRFALLDSGKSHEFAHLLRDHAVEPLFAGAVDLAEWDRWVLRGQYTLTQQTISDESAGVDLRTQAAMGRLLPLIVSHGEQLSPVGANTRFEPGDKVTVLEPRTGNTVQIDRFDRLVTLAPILDLPGPLQLDEFLALVADRLAPELGMEPEEVLQAYRARERDSGTVMGQGVAMPHITLSGENRLLLLIARCREGVNFGPDDESIHTIFVMASSRDQRNTHLRCLSAIAQIVQGSKFEAQWFAAESPEQLRELLLTARRRRF